MTDYKEVKVSLLPYSEDAADLLAALLADIGYDSFVQEEDKLIAYIPVHQYNKESLQEILDAFPMQVSLTYETELIEGQDWNEEWEKNYFQPIVIEDQCVIHSTFHKNIPEARYDIVIDPKMAFGTGHHSTTSLIIRYILSLPMEGKSVIDMGTGTGILAILCKMRGAANVTGIEIDPDAYANAIDNVTLNHTDINLINGDVSVLKDLEKVDYFFANINRNIVVGDMEAYIKAIAPEGQMILSGFYKEDIPIVRSKATGLGFRLLEVKEDKNWVALSFSRENN